MAFAQLDQSTSSLADLMQKLYNFATTGGAGNPGWTGDRNPGSFAGEFAISIAALGTNTNDVQAAAGWDTGGPNSLAIYQYNHASGAGNYNAGRAGPWDQDNDSGSGAASASEASIVADRRVIISNTPLRYWAFAGDTPVKYFYVVVETSSGEYRHFGWGELLKFNDWTGGAFAYGFWKNTNGTGQMSTRTDSSYLLDGYSNSTNNHEFMATINAEGLPNQTASGMYCVVAGSQSTLGTDRQGNGGVGTNTARDLFQGGFRSGPLAMQMGPIGSSALTGFVTGYPISCFYVKSGEWHGPMGVMDGVRGVNIDQFTPGEVVTIGGTDWVMFPTKRKSGAATAGGTGNSGIMYRVNT